MNPRRLRDFWSLTERWVWPLTVTWAELRFPQFSPHRRAREVPATKHTSSPGRVPGKRVPPPWRLWTHLRSESTVPTAGWERPLQHPVGPTCPGNTHILLAT